MFLTFIKVADKDIQKLFKRSRLEISKFAFSDIVVDKWNSLSYCCVNCTTINNFKSHIAREHEPEARL